MLVERIAQALASMRGGEAAGPDWRALCPEALALLDGLDACPHPIRPPASHAAGCAAANDA